MSDHYYNAADLAKFGNIGEYQKELADKFFGMFFLGLFIVFTFDNIVDTGRSFFFLLP